MKTPRLVIPIGAALIGYVGFVAEIKIDGQAAPLNSWDSLVCLALALFACANVAAFIRCRLSGNMPAKVEFIACVCETLLFVGAGYCTNIPPGVVKLAGVLPLGWSCAVVVMWTEFLRALAGRPKEGPFTSGAERLVILGIGTVSAMIERWMGREPLSFHVALTVILIVALVSCMKRLHWMRNSLGVHASA